MLLLSNKDLEDFARDGFLLVPGVYDKSELLAARLLFEGAFKSRLLHKPVYDSETLLTDIYTYFPELANCIFNKKYMAVAKDLLGQDALFIPECAVHRERYPTWHTDTTEQEKAGIRSHFGPNAGLILQFATYFQDNNEQGGGLTIIPETQYLPDPFLRLYQSNKVQKIWNRVMKTLGITIFDQLEKHPAKIDVPTKLGDLLVFDVRVFHRATGVDKKNGIDKLAIFNTFVEPQTAGLDYFYFMKQRLGGYYRYFQEVELSLSVRQRAAALEIEVLY
jgi:Phytanoyl-CoA dioxygenase (PhyH)